MTTAIHVKLSDGSLEPINYDKINNKVDAWCEGIEGVSPSVIATDAKLHMYDGIPTTEINNALLDCAKSKISDLHPGYQYVTARAFLDNLQHEVFGASGRTTPLYDFIENLTSNGYYDPQILKKYTREDIEFIEEHVDFGRDKLLSYSAVRQLYDKYFIQDRVKKIRFEVPQYMMIIMSMAMHLNEPKHRRNQLAIEFYDGVSKLEISMPTPIMAGVRGTVKQYASCSLIQAGDSLPSINAASDAAVLYGSKRAGLGIDVSDIRALGSKVGDGSTFHTGIFPFMKYMLGSLKSCVTPDTIVEILDQDQDDTETEDIANPKTKKIKIKDLKIGDMIKTFENGEITFKPVIDKFDTIVNKDEQRIVELDNGTKIHCSIRHPFMCMDGLNMIEVKPDELTNQHLVIDDGGETTTVVSVTDDDQPTSYIDITVEDTETFFCSDSEENEQVLTHNCSQGGIRGTASTMFFPFWHLELESLLVLKNNRGTEENRLRHSDYGLKLNKVFYERALKNQDLYLFSPHQVPKLKEAFYSSDIEEFERLYEEYAKDSTITKKVIPARSVMDILVEERSSTGRIYVLNIDHANSHSPFNNEFAQVRQSNLCMEILLVSRPFLESVREGYSKQYVKILNRDAADNMISRYGFIPKTREGSVFEYVTSVKDMKDNIDMVDEYEVMEKTDAEVALCILGAINLGDLNEGNIHSGVLEDRIYKIVRGLDNLIDLQEYPVKAGEISAKMRRTLGIGVTNFAYFLAKNGVRYSDGSGNDLTHILFEAIQYYAIKASVSLAKERGKCEYFGDTNYAKGILPIDTYKSDVDELTTVGYKCDWEELRQEILRHGMRHSTLTALMPVESSARVTNSINGIEPPKALFTVKDGIPTVVPEVNELFMDYETMWEMDNRGYIHLVAIMQKFIDQSISANTHYDPSKMPQGKVPSKVIISDLYEAYRLGVKTLYYHYTNDNSTSDEEEHCDSCAV